MTRLLKASLMAPIMFTIGCIILISGFYRQELERLEEGGTMAVAVIAVGMLIVINVLLFFVGAPYYYFLHKKQHVSMLTIVTGGVIIGGLAGASVPLLLGYGVGENMLYSATVYAVSGFIVSMIVWLMGVRTKPQKAPTE